MTSEDRTKRETDIGANPLPLGYGGLALVTALFGAYNMNQFKTGSLMLAAMLILYGGLAQFVAGILAYRNRDTIALTIFGSFGAFFGGLGLLAFNAQGHLLTGLASGTTVVWIWFCWAVIATYIWIATLRLSGAVAVVQLLLAAMFWALWLGVLTHAGLGSGWTAIAGWLGFATAVAAAYTSFAELINRTFGRMVLPEFPVGQLRPMSR
jgi:succinate-acetate transporter protein